MPQSLPDVDPSARTDLSHSAGQSAARTIYKYPSVHEVVVDIQFGGSLDRADIALLPDAVVDTFDEREPLEAVRLEISPGGHAQPESMFEGWTLRSRESPWVLQAQSARLSLHFVRSKGWPSGDYVGWDATFEAFSKVHHALLKHYTSLPVRRVGLRYINLVAVPRDSEPSQWLRIGVVEPEGKLGVPTTFRTRQVWNPLHCSSAFAASVSISTINVRDAALAEHNYGLLLDIDVFGSSQAEQPSFAGALDWFSQSHVIENYVFEACITDELRKKMESEHA